MHLNKNISRIQALLFFFVLLPLNAQEKIPAAPFADTIKAGRFDNGRMWTFDLPPKQYFKDEYNFLPNDDWFANTRMAALRFANYCSASFVSADGLIMTNHHCARESVTEVQQKGEDFHTNGFYALTLADERKVEGLYVDQLIDIKDISQQIQSIIERGRTETERMKIRDSLKKEIARQFDRDSDTSCALVTFYNGGKYSVYTYRRYRDVRLVFAPEVQMGAYGGDPDNFTYPRYGLDFSFFRVYDENGKPLKTDHYFKWSTNGAADGEPVFVVGNPARTGRLRTVAQLEYARDIAHPVKVNTLQKLCALYREYIDTENPENKDELEDRYYVFTNSLKASSGVLAGLRNQELMLKKQAFENEFRKAVEADPALNMAYGDLWIKIRNMRFEMSKLAYENAAFNLSPYAISAYFKMAREIVDLAVKLKNEDGCLDSSYVGDALRARAGAIFPPEFNMKLERRMLSFNLEIMRILLGENYPIFNQLFIGKSCAESADALIKSTSLNSAEAIEALFESGAESVLKSSDPFISFAVKTKPRISELNARTADITAKENDYLQKLGQALYRVYGTDIPPDATFTLRLSDGIIKGYEYNGTTAPSHTTFYGLYDRYYSHNKKWPWNLPDRWIHPSKSLDLETPMCFVSTNDIIGGNSGSPVINKNAEIVGLAFDGNIESLPGEFIFSTDMNRMVGVHSAGMMEALKKVYVAQRLSRELQAGKIVK